jgi:hypothetical protein
MKLKKPNGLTECQNGLNDIMFPVKIIDNPRRANREYSKIVVGKLEEDVLLSEDELKNLSQEEADLLNETNIPPIKRADYKLDLNYCSPRYELVPNADIFPKINAILMKYKINYSVNYYHDDFARFYADYQIEDKRYTYKMKGTSDVITPMLRIQHSYNGLTKYKITFGYFRLVCTNGLVIAIQDMKQFNLCLTGKHTSSILNSLKRLNDLMESICN